jgi:hypothetical protein
MNTIEKTTTTAQSLTITDNPDGSFALHGELADRVRAGATARGITPDEYADLAIMEERSGEKLPLYMDADNVRLLREICEAGGITADDFADSVLTDLVAGSVWGTRDTEDIILDKWRHDDAESVAAAMQAVVDGWNAKRAALA